MLRGSAIEEDMRRGFYNPLPEEGKADGSNDDPHDRSHDSSRAQAALSWPYMILSAFCGFVLALILVNLFPGAMIQTRGNSAEETKLQRLLNLPTEAVTFSPDSKFQEAPTPASDMVWESLLGPSLGLVSLDHSEKYGLPPGDPKGPHTHVYQVTVAHQIQCLFLIRKVYWSSTSPKTGPPSSAQLISHTSHCFDYLLQSIRCSADMGLEWKTDSNGNFVGWDVAHTCKRWDRVMDFLERHKYAEAEKAIDHHDHDD